MIFCASILRWDSGRARVKSKLGDDIWLGNESLNLVGVLCMTAKGDCSGPANFPNTLGTSRRKRDSDFPIFVVLKCALLGCISSRLG